MEILNLILDNLINIAYGISIFIIAYLSNMLFSLYYNIKVVNESFDYHKLIKSGLKVLAVGLGTALLSISITSLPVFAQYVGFNIPDEYEKVFNDLVIISVYLTSACKYILEAYQKLRLIVTNDNTDYNKSLIKSDERSKSTTSFIDTNSRNNRLED